MKQNSFLLLICCFWMQKLSAQRPFKPLEVDLVIESLVQKEGPGLSALATEKGTTIYSEQRGVTALDNQTAIEAKSHFRMASISKHVTAFSLYKLIETRKITLNQTIGKYFPKLPSRVQQITIAQLLQHSSGILDYENLLPATQREQILDADILPYLETTDSLYFTPGTKFRYSNTGYCLLALIIEQVSGLPYPQFVKNHIFTPIGLTDALIYQANASIPDRAYGYHPEGSVFHFADQSITSATKGDGGVYFSSNDFHQWARHIGKTYLSDASFKPWFLKNSIRVIGQIRYSMGLFYYQDKLGNLYCFHSGESTGFNNIMYIDVTRELIVSIFSNRDDAVVSRPFEDIMLRVDKNQLKKSYIQEPLFDWLSKVYTNEPMVVSH
ncbi:class A beta-lactamase-related serine hydrolase [Sphingobacterium psychroaquaticum]|nr:class A beta-lactamase-related serine hydrolase [Sphingobacterium psychroaquaticum]